MSYILVLYIYAGMMAKGDSVSLVQIPGFPTEQSCRDAGRATDPLVSGSTKDIRFVCLKQPK
jgi:hypothetical protein